MYFICSPHSLVDTLGYTDVILLVALYCKLLFAVYCTAIFLVCYVFQYDDAYIPKKLSNWQHPKLFDEVSIVHHLCHCTKNQQIIMQE